VNGGSGTDSLSFSSAVTSDLDFSKLSSFETLTFGSNSDTITFGTDEFNAGIRTLNLGDGTNMANLNANTTSQVQVNGGSGNDEFVLDFSRINDGDYQLDGVSGSDIVKVTGSWSLSGDMNFAASTAFDNIETLDLTGLSISGDTENDFIFSGDMISSWTDSGNSMTLKITSGQENYIDYTDVSSTVGNTVTFTNGAILTIETV